MKPSAVKEQKEVSFREHDGVKLPDRIVQSREARDVTLRFTIGAPIERSSSPVMLASLSSCSGERTVGWISTFRNWRGTFASSTRTARGTTN